ncbi:MAG: hypothetical protein ABI574_01580 [Burkholderiales bacterium]
MKLLLQPATRAVCLAAQPRKSLPSRLPAQRPTGKRPAATSGDLDQALATMRQLAQSGYPLTLGCVQALGDQADSAQSAVLQALAAMASLGVATTLACDASVPLRSPGGLSRLLEQARSHGVAVLFDQLCSRGDPASMETLLQGLDAMGAAAHQRPTLTLVGRWLRSRADADWACERGLPLRIIKGHQADPHRPLHDAQAGLLSLLQRVAGRASFVTLATNDPVIAHEGLRRLRRAGTACELELLRGLPGTAAEQVARRHGVPVRMYVPWGEVRLPSTLSVCTRDPRETGWVSQPVAQRAGLHLVPA